MIINQVVKGSGGGTQTKYGATIGTFLGDVDSMGVLQSPSGDVNLVFSGVKQITQEAIKNKFNGYASIKSATFPDLEVLTYNSCMSTTFRQAGITVLSMPKLTVINGENIFSNCCENCTSLEFVDLPVLEEIKGTGASFYRIFMNCTKLKTLQFKSLKTLATGLTEMCYGCSSLESIWFYALTDISTTNGFYNMVRYITGCAIHLPMGIDSTSTYTVAQLGTYPNFGGTNTTVLFDIVTTLTGADGNTYTRQEKDSTTTATAWVYNDTLYYTSGVSNNTAGVNEPVVSDTIYSDAACTQSVTTITAIA